jgi:predicted kinase
MTTREQFYKSKKWLTFRSVIINDRTDEDGFVHCCACGKPILHKYDLIIHHKKELDDYNCNDAAVALNPDNVECICFRCHNKEHERFTEGHTATYKPVQKRVYIVYGSPCSGKTTWVHDNATKDDLIVDLDSIWQMISINDRYTKPAALKSVVFDMRDKLYDIIKYRNGRWHNAYIIYTGALKGDRDRLKQRVSADELIYIDATRDECLKRANDRHNEGFIDEDQRFKLWQWIMDWFEQYQPD